MYKIIKFTKNYLNIPTQMYLDAIDMKYIPLKNLIKNPDILFVGINPHPGSYRRKVPFSNNKLFWYLLSDAGIINEKRENLKNDDYLKKLFKNIGKYRISFINLIDFPSRSTSVLRPSDAIKGKERLLKVIKKYKPKVICFVGKITYQMFSGKKKVDFGWQENIERHKVYVMHFPTRGEASIRIKELKEIKEYLNNGIILLV